MRLKRNFRDGPYANQGSVPYIKIKGTLLALAVEPSLFY